MRRSNGLEVVDKPTERRPGAIVDANGIEIAWSLLSQTLTELNLDIFEQEDEGCLTGGFIAAVPNSTKPHWGVTLQVDGVDIVDISYRHILRTAIEERDDLSAAILSLLLFYGAYYETQ